MFPFLSRLLIWTALAVIPWMLSAGSQPVWPQDYQDPNGLFTMTPPEGWLRKDYPQETQSRVRFTSPDGKGSIGVIVGPAGRDEADFDQLLPEKRRSVEELQKIFPQGQFRLSEDTICGQRCVRVETVIPGQLVQENYLYVSKGLHFNLDYNAPNQEDFKLYRRMAHTALCTIKRRP